MAGGCVYDCVHPWWGGNGTCVDGGKDQPAVCSCGPGYSSRGATGDPTCAPRRVVVAGYVTFSVISALATAVLLWHISQYRHLTTRWRSPRKTATRMKVLCSASVYTLGGASVGAYLAVQAGDKVYFDPGIIQAFYIVLIPSMMFGVAVLGEYWVTNLPSQLVAPGTVADKLMVVAEKHNAFVLVGCFNAGVVATFGVMTFFRPILATNLSDLFIAGGIATTMSLITFVAVQITGHISHAQLQASSDSTAFYAKAKLHVWQQAAALCGVGMIALAAITVRHLTELGRNTPVVTFTVEMLTATVASIIFALATRFPDPQAAKSHPSICSPKSTGLGKAALTRLANGNTIGASGVPPLKRAFELKCGGLGNVTAATPRPREELASHCPVHVKLIHGDSIPPKVGGNTHSRHGAAKWLVRAAEAQEEWQGRLAAPAGKEPWKPREILPAASSGG